MGKARDLANLISSGGITTPAILSATAGASVGAVGTYVFCANGQSGTVEAGDTRAGSSLVYSNAGRSSSGQPSGTWRCMGRSVGGSGTATEVTLWLRIS